MPSSVTCSVRIRHVGSSTRRSLRREVPQSQEMNWVTGFIELPFGKAAVLRRKIRRVPNAVELLSDKFALVQLDPKPGAIRHLDVARLDHEGHVEQRLAERHVFLNEKVRAGGVDLQAGGERDGPERTVRCD